MIQIEREMGVEEKERIFKTESTSASIKFSLKTSQEVVKGFEPE